MCGGLALGGSAVVCLEENTGMFVDPWIIEVKSSEAGDFIDYAVKKLGSEDAQIRKALGTQDGHY